MNSFYLFEWCKAFLFTQLVEVPIYAIALKRRWYLGFLASAITHPVVWFIIPYLRVWDNYWVFVLAAEGFAIIIEGLYLHLLKIKFPFFWSMFANLSSVSLGFLIRFLKGTF